VQTDPRYRVFISYAHDDEEIFNAVREALRGTNVLANSDKNLRAGFGFTTQIQELIAHSHAFIPILTERSHARGWVHQEIGYAVALGVPHVPIGVGKVPEGMIALAQAVRIEKLAEIELKVSSINLSHLVSESGRSWAPPSACALEPEERAEKIEDFAESALATIGPACVRMVGAFGSFSLPDEPPEHPAWLARYGNKPRGAFACRMFRRERAALARHADNAGLKMIVNCGLDLDRVCGEGVTRTRIFLLREYLKSLPDDLVEIVLVPNRPPDLALAVGDWFVAESMAARVGVGVLQTVFSSHAPTVTRKIGEFDQNLLGLLKARGILPKESRRKAIEELTEMIRRLPPHPAWSCDP